MKESKEQVIKRLKSNTYKMAFRILGLFTVTGVTSAIVGNYIDKRFEVNPYGTVGSLAVSYVITWLVVMKINNEIDQQRKKDSKKIEKLLKEDKKI